MKVSSWRKVDDILVGVDGPCDWPSCPERTGTLHARPHAHVVLDTDDGGAWIPFPFESKEGLKALLAYLKARGDMDFNDAANAAIIDEAERLGFPERLTKEESDWLSTPSRLETLTRYGFTLGR